MMSTTDLDKAANRVINFLRNENAVRISFDEIGNHKTVVEICDELKDLYSGDWTKVKNQILARGIPLCYLPGKGHYIGFKDEQVLNYVYKYKIARGWVKHLQATKKAIESSSPEAKEWIGRKFKDFKTEEEELRYA